MPDVVFLFKPSIKVPCVFADAHFRQIKEISGGEVYRFETEEELIESGIEAEILFTWGGTGVMPEEYCVRNKSLRWFHSFSSGMDPVMKSEISKLPIMITNSKEIHAIPIAEHVMGFIIAYNRTFQFMYKKQGEHVWAKGMTRAPQEAVGKTIGIIGAGSIGAAIARNAKAFRMKTIGLRRNPQPGEYFDEMLGADELDKLLSNSDYVVTSTPLTPETQHLIGAAELSKMKETALLINVSRGGVIDQTALIEALRAGKLGGAALDVTDPEPLPPDSPLWDMENVMITPHMSADTPMTTTRATDSFCDNLRRYIAGEPLKNLLEH